MKAVNSNSIYYLKTKKQVHNKKELLIISSPFHFLNLKSFLQLNAHTILGMCVVRFPSFLLFFLEFQVFQIAPSELNQSFLLLLELSLLFIYLYLSLIVKINVTVAIIAEIINNTIFILEKIVTANVVRVQTKIIKKSIDFFIKIIYTKDNGSVRFSHPPENGVKTPQFLYRFRLCLVDFFGAVFFLPGTIANIKAMVAFAFAHTPNTTSIMSLVLMNFTPFFYYYITH